jgi:hypothetical protein
LNDIENTSHPIGLAVERRDRVNLLLVDDYGLRTEFRDSYNVLEPDGGEVVYYPGKPEYFDHVLLTLSRTFLVSEITEAKDELDSLSALELFHEKVQSRQPRGGSNEYVRRKPPLRPTPTRPPTRAGPAGRRSSSFRTAA